MCHWLYSYDGWQVRSKTKIYQNPNHGPRPQLPQLSFTHHHRQVLRGMWLRDGCLRDWWIKVLCQSKSKSLKVIREKVFGFVVVVVVVVYGFVQYLIWDSNFYGFQKRNVKLKKKLGKNNKGFVHYVLLKKCFTK